MCHCTLLNRQRYIVRPTPIFESLYATTMTDPEAKLEEYRGARKWEGLIPAVEEPRVWDEGFRSFLLK